MKFVRICSWPVSWVLLINCSMQMKICLIGHQQVVRQVWIFSLCSLKLITKFQANLFVPITQRMHSLQSVWTKIQMRLTLLSDVPNARPCLRADRLGVRPTFANTRAMFSGVRSEGRPTRWPSTRGRGFFTPLSYPSTVSFVDVASVDSVHGEIRAESLQKTPSD
jgi:hypothetical protein